MALIGHVGNYLAEVMTEFGWSRAAVISSRYLLWDDMGIALRISLQENNITVAYSAFYDRTPKQSFMKKTMEKVKETARSKLLFIVLLIPFV